jgi:hypothetical protein
MKGSKMAKPKVMQRKSSDLLGVRLNKGMAVSMNGGWRGKVEQDCGEFVVCIRDGERPDIHWSGAGYRLVSRRSMKIAGNKAEVPWISTSLASRPTADREQRRRAVEVHLVEERARLASSWESATSH